MLDYTERQPATSLGHALIVAGAWYLKGFADAYNAHWAVAPRGPAGEQYVRGYALGQALFRQECFAAMGSAGRHPEEVDQPLSPAPLTADLPDADSE